MLQVTILAASFGIKKNVPIRANGTTCHVTGYHDALVLNLLIKVDNLGTADYIVSSREFAPEKCNKDVRAYPTFYSIKLNSPVVTVKTRSEKCIADTITPKYNCKDEKSQGISVRNFLVSNQYVDVDDSGLVDGQSYTVEVTVLPKNALLSAVSAQFTVTYTAGGGTRKRNLRELKAKASSSLSSPSSDALFFAHGENAAV